MTTRPGMNSPAMSVRGSPPPGREGWRRLLTISAEEATFARRGFRVTGARTHLEEIGRTFLSGYHAALGSADPSDLTARLGEVARPLRGFAYEGAAMALALQDALAPWRRDRLAEFLAGPGAAHVYMVHVGVGWAMARLPWRSPTPPGRPLDPLLAWLAIDGYGFHQGYFHPARFVNDQRRQRRATGYAARAFDQGLGRSVWFVEGADVALVADTVTAFAPARQPDLWSGVGLAATYAGGTDAAQLAALRLAAGPHAPHLAQGAAFAAKARQHAGTMTAHTDAAVPALTGVSATAAAAVTDRALVDLHRDCNVPAYEVWRRRIRRLLADVGNDHVD
jgi:enediyne biosynthesis protein E3